MRGKGILFERNESVGLAAYTDVDYVRSIMDRRSTIGYFIFLGGNLMLKHSSWQWHKGYVN